MPLTDSLGYSFRHLMFPQRPDLVSVGSVTEAPEPAQYQKHEAHGGRSAATMLYLDSVNNLDQYYGNNPADAVLLHLGMVDAWTAVTNPATTPAAYLATMTTIVDRIIAQKPAVKIIIGLTRARSDLTTLNATLDSYWTALQGLSSRPQVSFASLPIIADSQFSDDADGIHYNYEGAGSQAIANAWLAALTAAGI